MKILQDVQRPYRYSIIRSTIDTVPMYRHMDTAGYSACCAGRPSITTLLQGAIILQSGRYVWNVKLCVASLRSSKLEFVWAAWHNS